MTTRRGFLKQAAASAAAAAAPAPVRALAGAADTEHAGASAKHFALAVDAELMHRADGTLEGVRIAGGTWRIIPPGTWTPRARAGDEDAVDDTESGGGAESAPEGEGREDEARFARTLPPSTERSNDARMRERLVRRRRAIEARIEEALWDARIEVRTLASDAIAASPEGAMEGLGAALADTVVTALLEACDDEGGLGCTEVEARAAWNEDGADHARAWLESHAPSAHWQGLARALAHAWPDRAGGAPPDHLATIPLIEIASRGPALEEKLRSADPWVAREACANLWTSVLDEPAEMWPVRAVELVARMLGEEVPGEDAARAALADWRWPEMRPPLALIASGAGRLAPIEGDGAWAHAIAAMERDRWDSHPHWAQRMRRGEGDGVRQAMAKVRAIARESIETPGTGAARAVLARCARAWGRSEALKGSGVLRRPRLEPVECEGERVMMWVFDVESPEALVAGAALGGKGLAHAADKHAACETTLVLGLQPSVRFGFLREGAGVDRREERREALERMIGWMEGGHSVERGGGSRRKGGKGTGERARERGLRGDGRSRGRAKANPGDAGGGGR